MAVCTVVTTITLLVGCETEPVATGVGVPPAEVPSPPSREVIRRSSDISVGDTLELFVEQDPSYNGEYLVRERGDIIIQSVGRIPVAGLSVSEASNKIKATLEKSHLTQASVIVDRVGRAKVQSSDGLPAEQSGGKLRIFMTGRVARPGQHLIPVGYNQQIGVYEAILIAGGITKFGDEQKVHILRAGSDGRKHKIPVNVRLIETGQKKDPPVGHGDIIVVPEKVFGF